MPVTYWHLEQLLEQKMTSQHPSSEWSFADRHHTVADPGFPVGWAADLRRVHFSAKTYAKTKQMDPVGGEGRTPASPHWIRQCHRRNATCKVKNSSFVKFHVLTMAKNGHKGKTRS